MNIAIIPARGGSKRIPRKNIKDFSGIPMIAYAIVAAKESKIFDRIIVSTDDEEIAEIAEKWGAEIPFMRPAELADDYVETAPVIVHAIQRCLSFGWVFNNVCCIYPTVPFICADDIKGALGYMSEVNADYCFPITEYPSAIQRALTVLSDGKVRPIYPEFEKTRTQDLEPAFYDVGQFYWGKTDAWLSNALIHTGGLAYKIPSWRVVDIDTPEDWKRAEILSKNLQKGIFNVIE